MLATKKGAYLCSAVRYWRKRCRHTKKEKKAEWMRSSGDGKKMHDVI